MTVAVIYSRATIGIDAPLVTIEVHLSRGLPAFNIVGLPETAVKESKERVRSAIINNQFEFPLSRLTVNMAPADLHKEGGRFDLAIALGILVASQQISDKLINKHEFIGELGLLGDIRHVNAALPIAMAASLVKRCLIVPAVNLAEALLIKSAKVYGAKHLQDVCAYLNDTAPLLQHSEATETKEIDVSKDLNQVIGQQFAKRALEIAATGGHNLLMIGPPGSGKTMLAERMASILPPMQEQEALESAAISSVSLNGFDITKWQQRHFRAPHHTASTAALVGGGSKPKPGEISLAHQGVLFLDELPEFDKSVLEALREPLESGKIAISRVAQQVVYPADFLLLAAMNPCPCGYFGHSNGRCSCTSEQVQRYQQRISGPILDRIDIHIHVPAVPEISLLVEQAPSIENSSIIRQRVTKTQNKQIQRNGKVNARMNHEQIKQYCELKTDQITFLQSVIERLGLSARGVHRILKIARTIADMEDAEQIAMPHLSEAVGLRRRDLK